MLSENGTRKFLQVGGIIVLGLIGLAILTFFISQNQVTPTSEMVSPTSVAELILETNTSQTVSPNQTQTPEELPTPIETPSPVPTDLPSPSVITIEPRTVNVTKEPIADDEGSMGTHYVFSELVSVINQLPDNQFLSITQENGTSGFANTISIVNVDNSTISPILRDVHPKLLTPPQSDNLFVTVEVPPGKPIPVWAVEISDSEPIALGMTAGFSSPLYSATSDGRILFIENGHLTLKWIEGDSIHSQILIEIEEKLSLNWSSVD